MKKFRGIFYAVFFMLTFVHVAAAQIQRIDLRVEGMT
jgi:hypothetical protein